MLKIIAYHTSLQKEWDTFVDCSKNGTFLFGRQYMDYHQKRFTDCSLMIYKNNRLTALFPANITEDGVIYSHQGLTYGGLILATHTTAQDVIDIFFAINTHYKEKGGQRLIYKAIPHIYQRFPSDEDLYAMFKVCHAQLIARDIASVAIPLNAIRFSELRRRGIKKAQQHGVSIQVSKQYADFWQILSENLHSKYKVTPVHTLSEIELLAARFPQNIRLYTAERNGKVIGGTVIYETETVNHVQYISANEEGKAIGALDLLFDSLINEVYHTSHYFDFGRSTEQGGMFLNQSLIFQKEGFGGRGVCYDTYEWAL
ncbi:MAG: GNAT family N-acetyltransferase [Prevotella sp.]|nr:GNAT family N-acetyltransferase [Prevotella sp.]MDY3852206.1 GNAT family N-acetyltransferase [Prevotella sp.]